MNSPHLFPMALRRMAVIFGMILLGLASTGSALARENLEIVSAGNPGGGLYQTASALQQIMQSEGIFQKVTVTSHSSTITLAAFINSHKGNPNKLLMSGVAMIGAHHFNRSSVNLSHVIPIARLTGQYEVIVVPANSKIQTMKDLVAQFKAEPDKVSWGGGSVAGTDHVLTGMIAQALGVDPAKINYVAYAGGGATQASILGGKVTAGIGGYGEFEAQINAGKLRALAISSPQRIPGIDVPTLKEQGVDVELFNWRAIFAPPGITQEQKMELISVVEKTVRTPAWEETLKKNAWTDRYLAGDQFKNFFDAEQSRIEKAINALRIP